MITIEFPNKDKKEFKSKTTGLEIAKSISNSFAKKIIYLKLDGVIYDLLTPQCISFCLMLQYENAQAELPCTLPVKQTLPSKAGLLHF